MWPQFVLGPREVPSIAHWLRSVHLGDSWGDSVGQGVRRSLISRLHGFGKQDGNKNYNMKFQSIKLLELINQSNLSKHTKNTLYGVLEF